MCDERTTIDVHRPIAETPRCAMEILLSDYEPLTIADALGIHNAHVYKCRASGRISPTLKDALVEKGFVPNRKPYRRAAYFGRGPEARQTAEEWDERAEQWGGLTGLVRGIMNGKYEVRERDG